MPVPPPPEDSDKQQWVLNLVTGLRCAVCSRPYNLQNAAVVDRRQDAWVIAVSCPRCRTSGYVVVLTQAQPEAKAVMDLTPDEAEAVVRRPPITADDVLDLHFFLQDFEGDMDTLLYG